MTSNSLIVFATVLLVSSFAVCLITAVDPSEEEARLSQGACALQSDPALEDQYEAFYKSVRIRYGSDECDPERNFTDPAVCTGVNSRRRYGSVTHTRSKTIPCYIRCDNISHDDVMWCVTIFDHSGGKDYEVCIDSKGANGSQAALELGMDEHFELPTNCDDGCIRIKDAPFYLVKAVLTCKTKTDTCEEVGFVRLEVKPLLSTPSEIISINVNGVATLGSTAILSCFSDVIGTNIYSGWLSPETTFFSAIIEDPTCVQDCHEDTHPDAVELRTRRVRAYQVVKHLSRCPSEESRFLVYLVIDNVTLDDAKEYTCVAYSYLNNPSGWSIDSKVIPLETAFPRVDPILTSFTKRDVEFAVGEVYHWTCEANASSEVTLMWQFDGEQMDEGSNDTANCPHGDTFYTTTEFYQGNYISRFVSTLHVCSATEEHIGMYTCVVWDPETNLTTHFSERSSLSLQPSSPNTNTLTVAIAVPVVVIVSLIFIGVFIGFLLAGLSLHNRYHSKPLLVSVFEKEDGFEGVVLTKYAENDDLLSLDPLEFPRGRLSLCHDKVLGEGTFGLVLRAKAQGIIKDSPHRSIVAVKTVKENASPLEVEDLRHELILMKKMKPHGNVLNLLGHCTTSGGPLYLIVEYAMYGSLKDFLRKCEEAVLSLNHIPRAQWRSRSSCSSTSSTYPLLIERSSVSAQNSVFSTGSVESPVETRSFDLNSTGSEGELGTPDGDVFNEPAGAALATGDALPLAHTVSPITHDYVNSKGLVYMEDINNFALQIACGLQHLQDMEIVHCDLAARNILIAEGFVLKIADYGMAKEVGVADYCRKSGRDKVPVKWTAPEALRNHVFSYKSDMWSFGIILWEIFTYGHQPYPDMKIAQTFDSFISFLEADNKLSQPDGCPDSFYKLMLHCWSLEPKLRPSASEVVTLLTPTPEEQDPLQSVPENTTTPDAPDSSFLQSATELLNKMTSATQESICKEQTHLSRNTRLNDPTDQAERCMAFRDGHDAQHTSHKGSGHTAILEDGLSMSRAISTV